MSRIGKKPITLPAGVTVSVDKGNLVRVKGAKGELSRPIDPELKVEVADGVVTVVRPTEQKRHRESHGLSRTLINNMVMGVSQGYAKELEVIGVGYKAEAKGQVLDLNLGYSHTIVLVLPSEITVATETLKGQNPKIRLGSIDNELLGHMAAKIRAFRGPEPYKGKGIRYLGEQVRRKAGKAAAKK